MVKYFWDDRTYEEDIHPCKGCEDFDITNDSCKSKGGCGEKNAIHYYILIAGTRTYDDYVEFEKIMNGIIQNKNFNILHIVSGGARGADALAKEYATSNGYEYHEFKANWDKFGKRAGYIRNSEMHKFIEQFDNRMCVCFWDGVSKGTSHNFTLVNGTELIVYDYIEKRFVQDELS